MKLFDLSFKNFFFIQWFSHFYKYRYWIWQNISLKVDALILYKRELFFIMTENKKPKYTLRKVRSLFKNRSSFSSFFTHFIFPQPFNNSHSHRIEYVSHPATKQMTMILLARGLTSTLPFLWQTTNAPQRLRAQNPGITRRISQNRVQCNH